MQDDRDGKYAPLPSDEPAPEFRYRAREGPAPARPSSPAWDTTSVRVSRTGKVRFDRFRLSMSRDGRVLPHWEAFERLLDAAGVV